MNIPTKQQSAIKESARFLIGGELPNLISAEIFQHVADAFDQDKNIISVPAIALAESFNQGLAVLVLNPQGAAIGYTRLIQIHQSGNDIWYELGSTWVDENYRNQGLITISYRKLLAQNTDKNILAATSHQAAIAVGRKLGFVFVARRELPVPVWQACCICPREKTGVDDNNQCERAYGEAQQVGAICYTRVTPTTAQRFNLKVLAI